MTDYWTWKSRFASSLPSDRSACLSIRVELKENSDVLEEDDTVHWVFGNLEISADGIDIKIDIDKEGLVDIRSMLEMTEAAWREHEEKIVRRGDKLDYR